MRKQTGHLPGLREAGSIFDKVLKPVYTKFGFVQAKLLEDWVRIVGKTLAPHTRPVRLIFKGEAKSEGLLVVEVYHSSLATQMLFMEPIILEKIATYFGYKAVAKIKLVQKPMARPLAKPVPEVAHSPQKKVAEPNPFLLDWMEPIEDELLKERLKALSLVLRH